MFGAIVRQIVTMVAAMPVIPVPEHVGDVVRRYREELGLYRKELATRLGVSASTVTRWESGEVSIQPKYFKDISEILDIPLEELRGVAPKRKASELVVHNPDRLREWNRAVSMSEMSIPARAVLNVLSTWVDETHWVSALRPSEVSEKGNIPAEEVEGCWAEIVQSPFVEQLRDDVDWWFRLVIPPS